VEADEVGSGFREELDLARRVVHHQVHVKEHIRCPADAFQHRAAVGYLIDERAVHYVEVYPVDIRRFAARELPGYIREVAGKQRS